MTRARSAADLLEAVDRGDVRMVERREQLRLAPEAGEAFGIGSEELGQDLQRDVAAELRVARAIDLAHAAGAEQGGDPVRAEPSTGGQRHVWLSEFVRGL